MTFANQRKCDTGFANALRCVRSFLKNPRVRVEIPLATAVFPLTLNAIQLRSQSLNRSANNFSLFTHISLSRGFYIRGYLL